MPPKPLDKPFFCDRFLLCLLCTFTRRYLDTGKIMVSTADQGPAGTEVRTVITQIPLAQSWKIKFCPRCHRKKERDNSWAGQLEVRALPRGSREQG